MIFYSIFWFCVCWHLCQGDRPPLCELTPLYNTTEHQDHLCSAFYNTMLSKLRNVLFPNGRSPIKDKKLLSLPDHQGRFNDF